jgi:putative ABC transport system permease protein
MTFANDLRYAARNLAKAPGFSAMVVATLGLGIGVTAVIFVAVNAVLLRPFPYLQEQHRLAAVGVSNAREGWRLQEMSYADFHDVREQVRAFAAAGAHATRSYNLASSDGEPERIEGEQVSASLFPMLGVAPQLGRGFTAEEDVPGGARVVLIGDQLWRRRFGGERAALGATLMLNGVPHTVVGVMPPGFSYPADQQLWTPLQLSPTEHRGSHFLDVEVRLRADVTFEQAALELSELAQRLQRQYPETNREFDFELAPMRERNVGEVRPVLMIMLASVGMVLLIACANVANLLLARATGRRREMAVRTALGAGRARLVRQLLTESLLLALGGAALGLVLAAWGNDLIVAALPSDRPFWMQFVFDWRVFAFTGGVAVLTALVFGLAPALHASRTNLSEGLKDGAQGAGASRRQGRLRATLVVAEVSLSVVLLVGAGLMMRSFWLMQTAEPGFERRGLLAMNVFLAGPAYDSADARELFLRRAVAEVGVLPGVTSAAWFSSLPLSRQNTSSRVDVEGRAVVIGEELPVGIRVVHGDPVATLGVPLRGGRGLTARDAGDVAPRVLINRTMAERLWPGGDAVGRRIRFARDTTNPWMEIAGVVGDVRGRTIDEPPGNEIWLTYREWPFRTMTLAVRTSRGDPLALAGAVRGALRGLDGGLPVFGVTSMEQVVARSFWERALYGKLFGTFGAVAALLAAIGLYGVVSYGVSQRTREFGVRMALGAGVREVLALVMRHGVRLTLAGVAIGSLGAVALTSVLRGFLYGVGPRDPATFGAVIALLVGVALLASWIPARRAARVAPSEALRYE